MNTRKLTEVVCLALASTAVYAFVNVGISQAQPADGMFNPDAKLDTSQIDVITPQEDDAPACWIEESGTPQNGPAWKMDQYDTEVPCDEKGRPILLPTDADTPTPTILYSGVWVPEESPEGGYPTHWRDNSPAYSDDWMLQVNDSTHTIQWIAPNEGH